MIQTMFVVLFYDSREKNNITYFFQQCVRITIFWKVVKLVFISNCYFCSLQWSPSEQLSCPGSDDRFGLDVEQDWNAKLEHVPEDFIVLSLNVTDEIQVLIRVEEFLTKLWQVDLQKSKLVLFF